MFEIKNIKAIFFDLDGTLRYSNPPSRDIFVDEVIRQGIPVSKETRLQAARWEHYYFGGSPEVYADAEAYPERKAFWVNYSYRVLLKLGATLEQAETLKVVLHEYMNENNHLATDELMPGVLELLNTLKQTDIILGVVSNRDTPFQDYLQQLGLAEYFRFSLAAGEVKSWKPDKAIFEHALQRVGVQAHETLYVGDNYYADVVGARNAGIHPVLIDVDGIFDAPDCAVVCSYAEFLDLLQQRES